MVETGKLANSRDGPMLELLPLFMLMSTLMLTDIGLLFILKRASEAEKRTMKEKKAPRL